MRRVGMINPIICDSSAGLTIVGRPVDSYQPFCRRPSEKRPISMGKGKREMRYNTQGGRERFKDNAFFNLIRKNNSKNISQSKYFPYICDIQKQNDNHLKT